MTTMVELLRDLVTRDQLRCTFDGGRKLSSVFATDEAREKLAARGIDVERVPDAIAAASRTDFSTFGNRVMLEGTNGLHTGMSANELAMGLIGILRMPTHAQGKTGDEISR